MLKMNSKMGGVNHTLAERIPSGNGPQLEVDEEDGSLPFQQPPRSISWLFDEPCMVVVSKRHNPNLHIFQLFNTDIVYNCFQGVDVNHPDQSSKDKDGPSVLALVASMDGMLGQVCGGFFFIFHILCTFLVYRRILFSCVVLCSHFNLLCSRRARELHSRWVQ
jgi:hypothetical protein